MAAEILQFPEYVREPLEPVSELIAASPELWARLIGSKATRALIEIPDNIVLGSD